MNEEQQRLLQEKGLAFFGVVTASVTHELKNCLSIINEYSGLLEDLLQMSPSQQAPSIEKLNRVATKITRQVDRADRIIKRLNQFAHTVDHPMQQLDLGGLIEAITNLTRRLADMKRIRLETELPEDSPALENNPFFLQQAIFICFQQAMNASRENDCITIGFEPDGEGVRISVRGGSPERMEHLGDRENLLSLLVSVLGGRVEFETTGASPASTVLWIPLTQPGSSD